MQTVRMIYNKPFLFRCVINDNKSVYVDEIIPDDDAKSYPSVTVDIPEVVDGVPVTDARRHVLTRFADDYKNAVLKVPGSFWSIGDMANCGYSHVVLKEGITAIETAAFLHSSFTSISLPLSLRRIEESAFCECSNLLTVRFPANLSCVGRFAFQGCRSLRSVYFDNDDGVIVDDYAFLGDSSLEKVYYNSDFLAVPAVAFGGCVASPEFVNPTGKIESVFYNGLFFKDSRDLELPNGMRVSHVYAQAAWAGGEMLRTERWLAMKDGLHAMSDDYANSILLLSKKMELIKERKMEHDNQFITVIDNDNGTTISETF